MSENLPCPSCGNDDVEDYIALAVAAVICKRCGMRGPRSAWNTRAPALTWTAERPTVSGWYWLRDGSAQPRCVHMPDWLEIQSCRDRPGVLFAGPIPAPAEPVPCPAAVPTGTGPEESA